MKPPWSRWSTLSAGFGFVARDSAHGPLIFLGGSRTCARCRDDTASRSSNWPGSIPAASTFSNNFQVLLHDRPPKSRNCPNGSLVHAAQRQMPGRFDEEPQRRRALRVHREVDEVARRV